MFSLKTLLVSMVVAGMASPIADVENRALNPGTFVNDMLNAHNYYRRQHGVSDVTWSADGAAYAQKKANSCIFGHQNPVSGFGENIFSSSIGGGSTFYDPVNAWGQERSSYNWNSPGFSMSAGHFTQLVWASTHQIGCAWKDCGDGGGDGTHAFGAYVVCKYAPPGNVEGGYKTNVLPQRSGRPTDKAHP
ncbi:SCP protein [Geosmithia morbida]|uniref:SCP protein n=1 Tax=Geosmithia morbida TaxID=1094350 RepID=A0A9P5D736_9HYPO|nr:SCP protein [Geosmithia morbida]KAF4126211.1 SCP protein [Geosmithia morbida]